MKNRKKVGKLRSVLPAMPITALGATAPSAQAQILQAYLDQNNDTYAEWTAQDGYTYTLQRSEDMEFWENDSTWPGHGQTISILVHEGPNNGGGGGGGGAIPGLPSYSFGITTYSNGNSLISFSGTDGNPYQLYTTNTYFQQGDDPLFATEVTNPNGDYELFLHRNGITLPPNFASLTLGNLPVAEQNRVGLLTSVRAQIVSELAANGGTTTQTGAAGVNVGDKGFFRLLISRNDSDGDGLFDNIENLPAFNTNPFDPDSDQDGVTDPWDHANIGHVIISEFMASNTATIRDGNNPGEYEDYIELFNPTPTTANLSGYYLGCNVNSPLRWQIPAGFTLAPGQSRIIFASDNDQTDPGGNPHTDFGLSASGEDVVLSASNGTLVDSHPSYGRQRTNASAGWGLDQETGLVSKLRFFLDPTPGALNNPVSCTGFSEAPIFNKKGGIFSNSVQSVTISPTIVGILGEQIHYTLDGSNPTENSPVYSGPLSIDSTTIVRAISVVPGCIPSPIQTRSFLYKEDILGTAGQGQPVVDAQVRPGNYQALAWNRSTSLGPLDYEMDPDVIPDHYNTIFNDLSEIPTFSITLPKEEIFGAASGFYAQSNATTNDSADPLGTQWQRLASFEYIDPNNAGAYSSENGEVTISGASSRSHSVTRKHNMRMRFKARNSISGSPTFSFDTAPFATSPVQNFVQMQLRNPTHDSWAVTWNGERAAKSVAVREAWAREIHRQMNPVIQNPAGDPFGNVIAHRKWVHLFLNGLYWGVYDLSERVDQDFGRAYGDPNADYDVLSNSGVIDGDSIAYNQLVSAANAAGGSPNNGALWQSVINKVDISSYVDYMIVNTYMHNTDWPTNNWRAIKRRAPGGKFKFVVWDAEFSFDSSSLNSDRTGVAGGAAAVHAALLNHPNYKQIFKNRVSTHFYSGAGKFSVSGPTHRAAEIFEDEMDDFKKTLFSESARWGDGSRASKAFTFSDPTSFPGQTDRGDWDRTSKYHRDIFIKQRRAIFLSQLQARGLAN